jgi:hypothetical protein
MRRMARRLWPAVFAAAALSFAGSAISQSDDDATRAADVCYGADGKLSHDANAYRSCVTAEATRLNTSGAAPQDVADAALAGCAPSLGAIKNLVALCDRVFASTGYVYGAAFAENLSTEAHQSAVRTVLEARIPRP